MTEPAATSGGPVLEPDVVRVLALVVRGWTDDKIARSLDISVSTVKRRLAVAREALGARSRVEVAVAAARLGMIDWDDSD